MLTYHIDKPSAMDSEGTNRVFNFAIRELDEDDPHYADGYRYVSHSETASQFENPADVLQRVIAEHDTSNAINSFLLNGVPVWLDKSTRVGLVNSITFEKAAGRTTSTLWFGGHQFQIPCDMALQLLSAIELYALECYNVTASHQAEAMQLATVFTDAQRRYSSLLYPADGEPTPSAEDIREAAADFRVTIDAILDYDFLSGYPERLAINV